MAEGLGQRLPHEGTLTAIMEAALDTIVVMNHEGNIVDVNAAVERTFGHRREEILGRSLAEVFVPLRYRERHREGLARYLQTGEGTILGKRIELEAMRSNGTELPVEITIVRVEADGPPLFTGFLRDVTERRATAEALRLSEERFRRLGESGIVGLFVAHVDGVLREANDAFLAMVGYTRDDLKAGRITGDALNFPEWEAGQQSAREQFAATGAVRPWEKEYRRKDGSRVPVLTAVTSVEPPHLLSVVLDLTAQRRAEETARTLSELREQDATIRELLDAAPDAMVIVDPKGKIVIVNVQAERLFGYRRDELLGQSVEVLVPERFRPVQPRYREGVFGDSKGGRATGTGVELFALRKDGTELPVEVNLSPLTTKEGTFVSGAIRDVTRRRRNEQELRRARDAAEAAVGELEAFSYSVAHDLRAPLRAINGFSVALTEDYGDQLDAQAKGYLDRISNGAGRMGQLIDALLLLARVSRTEPTLVPVNLGNLARLVFAQLAAHDPRAGVELVVRGELYARGDASLLRALLENLLGNSWKFGAKREQLRIELGSVVIEGGVTAFFVRDNGAGFDMEYAAKLFTPFQRLHGVSEFPGTGIGLATVERIVRRHGGRVWAEGAVNQGATFYFTLHDPRGVGT